MVGRLLQQCAEVLHCALVVAVGVARIAEPETRRGRVATLGVPADELGEHVLRSREVAPAEHGQGGVEVALLGGVGGELAAIDGHLGRLDALEAVFRHLQALLDGLGQVFLAALQLGNVPGELFVGATHTGQVAAQGFDLRAEVEHRTTQLVDVLARQRGFFGDAAHLGR